MVAYIDSSVALRHVLLGDVAIEHAFALPERISSELMEIECRRVLHRCRMEGELDDESLVAACDRFEALVSALDLVELSAPVKRRAMEAFPLPLRTLDALHLATALEFKARRAGEELLVFSFDRGMNLCARALGFATPLFGGA
jgi:predicted nucleic acid-binding protein